jgi:hypothetical protein
LIGADPERFHEILEQNLSRMDWVQSLCLSHRQISGFSVAVHDFDVMCIAFAPGETEPPLVVDANAVRPCPVPFQRFKLVSRRNAKILQPEGSVQVQQLAPRNTFDRLEPPHRAVSKERSGIGALERPDQDSAYYESSIMSNVLDDARTFAALPGILRIKR